MFGDDDDELGEPSEEDKASGDFMWDKGESEALWQALMDANLATSADGVHAFLKQTDNVVSLGVEEEIEMAKRIEAGRQATAVLTQMAERGEVPTDAHRADLVRICRDADNAKDDLLTANLRLVVALAKPYTGRGMAFGASSRRAMWASSA